METILNPIQLVLNVSSLSTIEEPESERLESWKRLYGCVSPGQYITRSLIYATTIISANQPGNLKYFQLKQIVDVLCNELLSEPTIHYFMSRYGRFKRIHNGFIRLMRIWKYRRASVQVKTDLCMDELMSNNKNTFILLQDNNLYYFSLQDLSKIVVEAITHNQGFFVDPLIITNPYTRTAFTKADLFNIYLSMVMNPNPKIVCRIPEYFTKFFRCEMNIYEFRKRHDTELHELAIRKYVKSASDDELRSDIQEMLYYHNVAELICVHDNFPIAIFIETMRPFLILHYLHRFSPSSLTRKNIGKELIFKLKKFIVLNPTFGRQIPNFGGGGCGNPRFITRVRPISKLGSTYYLDTHEYNDTIYDRYLCGGDTPETYSAVQYQTMNPPVVFPFPNIHYPITTNPSAQLPPTPNPPPPQHPDTSLLSDDDDDDANYNNDENYDVEDTDADTIIPMEPHTYNEYDTDYDDYYDEDNDSIS